MKTIFLTLLSCFLLLTNISQAATSLSEPIAEICLGHFSHQPELDNQFTRVLLPEMKKQPFKMLETIDETCQVTLSGDVYAELPNSKKGFYLFGRPKGALYTVRANLVQNKTGEVLWNGDFVTPKFSFVAKKDQLKARAADLAQALKNYYNTKGRISI
jgi:hypothetical protein